MHPLSSSFLSRSDLAWSKAFFAAFPNASLWVVGGAVRDALLKRPVKDLDLVAGGVNTDQLYAWLQKQGRADLVGRDFGVFKFSPAGSEVTLDLALPRTEQPLEGSLGGFRDFAVQIDPFLPLPKDLARRDFTINALALNLKDGTLLDLFEGEADLAAGCLRTVGVAEERFREDRTRLLRAMRFSVELGFTIEEATWNALVGLAGTLNEKRREADGREVWVVPRETVAKELGKALAADPEKTLSLLAAAGCRDLLLPKTNPLPPRPLTPDICPLSLTLALLWKNVGAKVLRTSAPPFGQALDDAEWILAMAASMQESEYLRASAFEKWFLVEKSPLLLAFLRATETPGVERIEARAKTIRARWYAGPGERIKPLLSGSDLLAAGAEPGPRVRRLLETLRDEQLEGILRTREEALARLPTLLQEHT